MQIFITGITGFIGRSLALRLRRDGHGVVGWVRDRARARAVLGADVDLLSMDAPDGELARVLSTCDAVINLAGAPISRRWTRAHRRALRTSRVDLTRRLVEAMGAAETTPTLLISASAVGFYPDGATGLDEHASSGSGFLPELCRDWEAAALRARDHGARVVLTRLGLVLGRGGGVLEALTRVLRTGLGGPLSDGSAMMPWVHLDDVLEFMVETLRDSSRHGPYNLTSPNPVTNREMTRQIARRLGRPAFVPAPAWAIRLVLGEAARAVLASQDLVPRRTLEAGHAFRHPALEGALDDLMGEAGIRIGPAVSPPAHPYLRDRPATHVLQQTIVVDTPLDRVFPFFSRAENLGSLTPPEMSFEIQTPTPIEMKPGARIDYRIRVGPVPMGWTTVIEDWQPGVRFVDAQHRGPYRAWFHEHVFEAVDDRRTRVTDRVHYAAPLGPLGRLANRLFIAPMLRRIFSYRAQAVALRFGDGTRPARTAARDAA